MLIESLNCSNRNPMQELSMKSRNHHLDERKITNTRWLVVVDISMPAKKIQIMQKLQSNHIIGNSNLSLCIVSLIITRAVLLYMKNLSMIEHTIFIFWGREYLSYFFHNPLNYYENKYPFLNFSQISYCWAFG